MRIRIARFITATLTFAVAAVMAERLAAVFVDKHRTRVVTVARGALPRRPAEVADVLAPLAA
jgi:hypothetical protein